MEATSMRADLGGGSVSGKKPKLSIALTLPTNHLRTWWQNPRRSACTACPLRPAAWLRMRTDQSVPRIAPRGRILEPPTPALSLSTCHVQSPALRYCGTARTATPARPACQFQKGKWSGELFPSWDLSNPTACCRLPDYVGWSSDRTDTLWGWTAASRCQVDTVQAAG